jgi:glycosyltransferase involved in cell wall biosynthesis
MNIMFDFSSVRSGGGLKRLDSFIKFFIKYDLKTVFIVPHIYIDKLHSNSITNKVKIIYLNRFCLIKILQLYFYIPFLLYKYNINHYYSYSSLLIPYFSLFKIRSWFHLSNIEPFVKHSNKKKLNFRLNFLYKIYSYSIKIADFVSVESPFSSTLIKKISNKDVHVSYNGIDEEYEESLNKTFVESNAVAVGCVSYKNIEKTIKCYKEIKKEYKLKKLYIIGNTSIDKLNNDNKDIIFLGNLRRSHLLKFIKNQKIFITSTSYENSFNSALEGILLCKISFISKIDVHHNLLKDYCIKYKNIPDYFLINNNDVKSNLLIEKLNWDNIISKFIKSFQ